MIGNSNQYSPETLFVQQLLLRLEHRRTVVGDELVVKTQIRIDVETLHRNLKQMFGFDDFRPGQLEVIESIARGEDVLSVANWIR